MSSAISQDSPPRFACPAGVVEGWVDGAVIRATGIRYARAGRFEVPVAEPPVSGVIDATSWSPACPQSPDPLIPLLGDALAGLPFDEDCLRLSVTMPDDVHAGERLPVMVWIHGGAYAFGAGDSAIYDPYPLVAEQRVVVVNVTYRLGLLGFLGGSDRPANLGLFDLIEALRWVQRNISGFGGDSDSVTVFGESAGGDAIAHLMIADGARGLFRRAIIQSPPLGISLGRSPMYEAMATAAARPGLTATLDDVLATGDAVSAAAQPFGLRGAMPFGAQYGMAPLPPEDRLDDAWAQVAPELEVLIGDTSREIALFTRLVPEVERIQRLPLVGSLLVEAVIVVAGWLVYGSGIRRFVRRHHRAGGTVVRYRLSWGPPHSHYRAAHGTDIPLLLGRWSYWSQAPIIEGVEQEFVEAAGRNVRALWAEFARSGVLPRTRVRGLIRVGRVRSLRSLDPRRTRPTRFRSGRARRDQ